MRQNVRLKLDFMMHNFLSWNFFRYLKAVQKWKGLDQTKLLQIGMAGPNVNLEFLELIQEDQNENEQHQLIDIGSCGLHKIHNAFKTSWTNWSANEKDIQERLSNIKRMEDFFTIFDSNEFPLNLCSTRLAKSLMKKWTNV